MTANEAYNELNRVCLEMEPPQRGLVELGRRIVLTVECRCATNRREKKDTTLLLLNDLVVLTSVPARCGGDV